MRKAKRKRQKCNRSFLQKARSMAGASHRTLRFLVLYSFPFQDHASRVFIGSVQNLIEEQRQSLWLLQLERPNFRQDGQIGKAEPHRVHHKVPERAQSSLSDPLGFALSDSLSDPLGFAFRL